jgi:hypothetical protein
LLAEPLEPAAIPAGKNPEKAAQQTAGKPRDRREVHQAADRFADNEGRVGGQASQRSKDRGPAPEEPFSLEGLAESAAVRCVQARAGHPALRLKDGP